MAAHPSLSFDAARRQVFVVGNEAGDVDSMVSAYVMAQFLESDEVQAIALAQFPREEFRLRGDGLQLFRDAGSELLPDSAPARLTFWDDVDWPSVDALEKRSLVLVDHNKMTAQVASHFDGDRVEWVLDHHADSKSYERAKSEVDESLGSACSLVAEQFLARGAESLSREQAVLLAGVILLDCRNFDPKEKKGTPRDRAALDGLAKFLPPQGESKWYDELMFARKDVSHLSVRDLMLLDTKVVDIRGLSVAFASMFGTIAEVCAKAGCPAEFQAVARGLASDRGYKAMVYLFQKDEATKKKAMAFVPLELDSDAARLCSDLVKHLLGTPGSFSPELRENPLFETQGLLETGFQLEKLEELAPLDAYSVKGTVSRKTVLPLAMTVSLL